ncbi:TlyA family RNA methyltransferase [Aestuariivirga sp.]|uniref:TlyA family RNA methyltransferase n=1 Tax=Aestuariivirga sp. TaxID=2650926 RepID=UPI00391D56D4
MSARQRLDEALVARGLYPSRSRARDAVLRGTVLVDGEKATKPSQSVGEGSNISLQDEARHYVSRAALKLKHGLSHFGIEARGRMCLDIGASTGGFTQVLLEQGAAHVTAVDVGHGQMKVEDPRLTLIEGLNARDLSSAHVTGPVDLIVCDVSFISLRLALPKALALAQPGAALVALIKPQFEAGREAVGKGGMVSDPHEHARVCREIAEFLRGEGWRVLGITDSPVEGGDGNREFLIGAVKDTGRQ